MKSETPNYNFLVADSKGRFLKKTELKIFKGAPGNLTEYRLKVFKEKIVQNSKSKLLWDELPGNRHIILWSDFKKKNINYSIYDCN